MTASSSGTPSRAGATSIPAPSAAARVRGRSGKRRMVKRSSDCAKGGEHVHITATSTWLPPTHKYMHPFSPYITHIHISRHAHANTRTHTYMHTNTYTHAPLESSRVDEP